MKADFDNIQASAIGLAASGGHIALLEDELEGKIRIRADCLHLSRDIVQLLIADASQVEGLDQIGIKMRLYRSPNARNVRGIFQFSADTEVDLMNELLNTIIRDLQLGAPPQLFSYQDLSSRFQVSDGKVETDFPLLEIRNLKMVTTDLLDLEGDIRLHLGRKWQKLPGEELRLRDLVYFFQRFLAPN
jgi:hypothetical protein